MTRRLTNRIEDARQKSLGWIGNSLTWVDDVPVYLESDACDLSRWPGMALPGTYNIAMLARLIGAKLPHADEMAHWILSQRARDGSWWLRGMYAEDTYKKDDPNETRFYLQGHITNYTLGGLEALGSPASPPDFARRLTDLEQLEEWMNQRNWDDPWQEGNNIVNLGGFQLAMARDGDFAAQCALDWLVNWHMANINPATGFWGNNQSSDLGLLHAMAGSCHNYHLFFDMDRSVPNLDKAVDYCLTQAPEVRSACIDADLVDILANAYFLMDYRREEIFIWQTRLAAALLDFQNSDGGFSDTTTGVRRFDGWINGYSEPQGLSCGFATLFRWIALAMIARVIDPDNHSWTFRKMVGLGYFRHR